MTTPGSPGEVTPATRTPGALRWTMYQIEGALAGRCGSLASKGFPEAVCLPLTTQLLLASPKPTSRPRRESERDSTPSSLARPRKSSADLRATVDVLFNAGSDF